jgi:hypothetical protein
MSLAQGAISDPRVSNSISRLIRQSKQHRDISQALMQELQSGVLGAGASDHVRRQAMHNAQLGKFFTDQAKIKGVEAASAAAGPAALGSAVISAAGTLIGQAIEAGAFDSVDDGAVEGSIGQGLRETISPGELTMKDAPQTYMSQLQTSPTSGPRRKLGESPMDMTLDTGDILTNAALQRDIDLAGEFGSQTFDPNRPFDSAVTAPSLRTKGYSSMGIAPMDTYVEKSVAPEAYSVKSPEPGAGPEDLMSLADINKTIDMKPRSIPANDMQGALGQKGTKKDVASSKLQELGNMTMNEAIEAMRDPKKQEEFQEYLKVLGGTK